MMTMLTTVVVALGREEEWELLWTGVRDVYRREASFHGARLPRDIN